MYAFLLDLSVELVLLFDKFGSISGQPSVLPGVWVFQTSLNPTLSSCVAVNKLLDLSEPQFLHLLYREIYAYVVRLL